MSGPDERRMLVLSRHHGRVAAENAPLLRDAGSLRRKDDGHGVVDLIEAGFLGPATEHGSSAWTGADQGEADRRLLRLLDRFELTVHVLPASGVSTAITHCRVPVGNGEEVVSFVGKGFAADDAIRGCLGEVAEFRSWLYDPEQDGGRIGRDPEAPRLPETAALLDCNGEWLRRNGAALRAAGWTQVTRLDDAASIWCPAPLCFGRYVSPTRAEPFAGFDNNGCAAGPNREEALARALLELIERDATGLWWQRGIARPRLDARSVASSRLLRSLDAHEVETGRECWFLDLTTDIAIPVVAAISVEDDGTLPALGVACRPLIADAVEGAFLEMVQSELSLAGLLQRLDEDEASPTDLELSRWFDEVDIGDAPWLAPHGVAEHPLTAAAGTALERLGACGLAAYAMELTREALAIPVVKAIVPKLAHFRRPQGEGRLLRVPEQLGWHSLLPGGGEINPRPLLI